MPRPEHIVYVWDRFVRLFHWGLVSTIVLNLFILEEGDPPHQWSGYIAFALIMMRIVWGFKGSQYAQFREFWPRASEIKKELFGLLHASPIVKTGHSAMGALMMISLVFNVILLAASGYAMGTDLFFGEEWVEQLHALLANALMILSAIHVLAALIIGRLEGVNLIAAMINGYKRFKSD